MVFKNGEIKAKKAPRGRPGACDEYRRQAGDIRQRKVQGSNPVAAKQDGRTPGPARPSSGSCQHSETPVGAKFVKALCASEIAKPSSGSCNQGAMPSSSAGSRVSADPNSRPRRRPDAEEGSESSRKQVCPYSYCSLNGRDPARQLSFKRFMDSRRGSAPSGAAGINSGARRDLGTENTRKKRCPYAYCSLNDGDRAKLLSFKRSRASRRGLMKKGFDAAVDDSEAAGNRSRGQGLNPPMADCDVTEDNTLMPVNCPCNGCLDGSGDSVNLSAESGEDRRPGCAACACKSTECDRGGLEFDVKPPLEGIRISESLFDGSGREPGADDFVKQLEEYKGGTVSPSVDVSACDVAEINCESYPQSEASDPHCFVEMDALGILCGGHAEPDRSVDESLLESTAGIEGEVKGESSSDAGNLTDESVSEIGASDCLEQSLGCKDDADSGQGNDACDYGCTMDDEPLCLVQIDGLGILCGGHTEADRPVDELLLESTAGIKGEVKKESGSDAGNLTDRPVSEIGADDCLEQSIRCKDDADSGEGDDVCDYGCTMDDEPLCLVQMDGLGILCGGHTEADRPVDELLLESTAGIEGEVKEESGTDAGNLMDKPVSEIGANDCLEQSIGCKDDADSGEGNDVCDYGCTMDDEPLCLVQMDGLGILCGGHTEADRPVDESLLELTAGIKAEVMKEESGTDAGNLMDEPVSDISANDCLAQFVGCEDDADSSQVNDVSDYDCSMDNEPLCLVQADNLEVQCSMLTNSDDLQGGSVNDNGASCKHEVKDEAIKIAESLLNGSDSEFCIDDSRQFAECDEDGQDVNNRSDSGVSVHETIEWNDYDYGDKGEHVKIAEDLLNGYNSECAVDDFRPFAEGNEDGDGHDCSLASDVSPHELTDAGDYDYGHGMDGVPCCFVQLEAAGIQGSSHEEPSRPLDGSRFNLCASPLTEVKEENINIAVPVSSVDRPPFELSASPNGKKSGKAEEYTNVEEAIVDHLVSEICANGSIKQLTEHDDGQNGHFRTGTDVFVLENKEFNDYDCDHHMDAKPWHSVQVDDFEMHCSNQTEPDSPLDGWPLEFPLSSESEVEEDYYKITAESSMNGPVAESSPCSGNHIKQCRHIAEENGNEDQQVKFRRRRYGHRFSEPISEVEKVNLRHQLIPERKAAEEWMIDYALIKMVNELSPLRKKKVEMLVEAFESVLPLSKCETNDLEHGRTNFSHIWPMQACN